MKLSQLETPCLVLDEAKLERNVARMRAHLNRIEARDELVSLAARRRHLENGLARLYKDIVAKAAEMLSK